MLVLVIQIAFIARTHQNEDDLYKLLGVAKDATVKEIRKAFKILAVKLHPDKNKVHIYSAIKIYCSVNIPI